MSRKLKRKDKGEMIERENLLRLLKQCHLGGALEECVLEIDDGDGTVELIDITNTITISSKIRVGSKGLDCKLGLGNLDLVIKFLSSLEDKKLTFNNEKGHVMQLGRKDGQRKLMYLLTRPELIITRIEEKYKSQFKKLEKKMEYSIDLEENAIRDLLSYVGMIKDKGMVLRLADVNDKHVLSVVYGNPNEHQFEVILDKDFDDAEDETFDIYLNSEFVAKILNVIEYDEDNKPTLAFSNSELPVMVKGNNTVYFITPITEVPF